MIETPGPHRNHNSAFDPRARILALGFFVVAVCAAKHPPALAGLAALALILVVPSGLSARDVKKRLLPVNAFMLLLWLTMPFLAADGARQALAITLKANAIVVAAAASMHAVETGALAVGLRRLGCPTKLVWLLILSHRYVIGMADKVAKSVAAIRLRSGGRGRLRLRAYGGLFAKLFVGGHESGERLYVAMRSRGYGGVFALRRELRWRIGDAALVGGMALLAVAAVWMDRTAWTTA